MKNEASKQAKDAVTKRTREVLGHITSTKKKPLRQKKKKRRGREGDQKGGMATYILPESQQPARAVHVQDPPYSASKKKNTTGTEP